MSNHEHNEALLREASAFIDLGRYQEAVKTLAAVAANDPASYEARCLSAQALLELKQNNEALWWAEEAISIHPDGEWGHRLRAIALKGLNQLRKAIEAAREAVRLAPTSSYTLITLAELLGESGKEAEALDTAHRAVEYAPNWAPAFGVRAMIHSRFRRQSDAERDIRTAIKLDPVNWTYHNNLGVILQRRERKREAVQAFTEAARLNPQAQTAVKNVHSSTSNYIWRGLPFVLIFGLARLINIGGADPLITILLLVLAGIVVAIIVKSRKNKLPEAAVRAHEMRRSGLLRFRHRR